MIKFNNIFEGKGYGCVCTSLPRLAFVAEIVIAPCGYAQVIVRQNCNKWNNNKQNNNKQKQQQTKYDTWSLERRCVLPS
jgi:hypothetical protein